MIGPGGQTPEEFQQVMSELESKYLNPDIEDAPDEPVEDMTAFYEDLMRRNHDE